MDKKVKTSKEVKMSCVVMGSGQIVNKQVVKGILFFLCLGIFIAYMILMGAKDLVGLVTLGTKKTDPWLGIKGDDSIMMLLRGILAVFAIVAIVLVHIQNIKDIIKCDNDKRAGKALPKFNKAMATFFDRKFYVVALIVPVVGVLIFNVLPIVFMTLIAFTNYGAEIKPPQLVDWIGFGNFGKIFAMKNIKTTFFKILGWNVIWAFASTALNYFCGLGLALLLNKKCVKGKNFWRAFPILAYAVPGFITFLAFKFMFSYGGPINYYIRSIGGSAIGFLDIDAGMKAKLIGLFVNAWINIPTSMLLATGILANMNNDLYEAASIDGASRWKQFIKITLPFVIFSTTAVLITNFVGNFNNFGVFYFLRGGLYMDGYFLASDTDLLINWLYNLSIDNDYYGIGAAISLIIFAITSIMSLSVYVRSAAFRKEDTFR